MCKCDKSREKSSPDDLEEKMDEVYNQYNADYPDPEPETEVVCDPKPKSVYNLWCDLFQAKVSWHCDPEGWQAWNGAVEVTLDHVVEHLCGNMSIEYSDIIAMKEKIRKKLIC